MYSERVAFKEVFVIDGGKGRTKVACVVKNAAMHKTRLTSTVNVWFRSLTS